MAGYILLGGKMTKFMLKRTWNDPLRNILMCILIILPSIDLLFFLKPIFLGSTILKPDYATFLTANSGTKILQQIYLWIMPLYCLILNADECIRDYNSKYYNILSAKYSKKKYVQSCMKKSFLTTVLIIVLGLTLNLLLCHIIFFGGKFDIYGYEEITITSQFLQWEIDHPLLNNLLFIMITGFVSGLISVFGTVSALLFKDKKIVYGVTLFVWFVPFLNKDSLMYLFQPHSEYLLDTIVPIGLWTCIPYVLYIIIGYFKEVYIEKETL